MEAEFFGSHRWLPVLVEEIGEVAQVICDEDLNEISWPDFQLRLREELVQVGAMTAAWIDAIDEAARKAGQNFS
jgi:NTP pyrophosphatase (non-canonical NTP hydrolase)